VLGVAITTGGEEKVAAAGPTLKLRPGEAPLLTTPHITLIPAITNVPDGRPSACPVIGTGGKGVIPRPKRRGVVTDVATVVVPEIFGIAEEPETVSPVAVTPPVVTPADVSAPVATIAPAHVIGPTVWGFPAVET
jgi:hypothetical protein